MYTLNNKLKISLVVLSAFALAGCGSKLFSESKGTGPVAGGEANTGLVCMEKNNDCSPRKEEAPKVVEVKPAEVKVEEAKAVEVKPAPAPAPVAAPKPAPAQAMPPPRAYVSPFKAESAPAPAKRAAASPVQRSAAPVKKPILADVPKPEVKEEKPVDTGEVANKLMEQMFRASAAFNVPTQINIDDTADITLLVDTQLSPESLAQAIEAAGEKVTAEIVVSRIMAAKIVTRGFEVEELAPAEQAITVGEPTEWKWRLTPKETGKQVLNVSLYAKVKVGEVMTERYLKTFEKEVNVNITAEQAAAKFVKAHWQWMWSALLIPVIWWGVSFLRKRRNAAKSTLA